MTVVVALSRIATAVESAGDGPAGAIFGNGIGQISVGEWIRTELAWMQREEYNEMED